MGTRPPFLTPSFLSPLANLEVSRWTWKYVSVRESSGESPSQTRAALFRRGPAMCRSRQLTLALSLPPVNHSIFAVWKSNFEIVFHFFDQVIRSACSPQNASGFEIERSYSA